MTTATAPDTIPMPPTVQRMGFQRLVQVIGELAGVAPGTVCGGSKSSGAVQAREIVCWLAHRYLSMSYPEIAEAMLRARSGHSTIIQAAQRFDAKVLADRHLFEAAQATLIREIEAERARLAAEGGNA